MAIRCIIFVDFKLVYVRGVATDLKIERTGNVRASINGTIILLEESFRLKLLLMSIF